MASNNNEVVPKETVKTTTRSPKRYLIEYYDALINHVDILAEEVLAQHDEKKKFLDLKDPHVFSSYLKKWPNNESKVLAPSKRDKFDEKYEEPISLTAYKKHYYEMLDRPSRYDELKSVSIDKYVNEMRDEMIDELRRVQDESVREYEARARSGVTADANFEPDNKEELARYKKKVFGDKFAFLIYSFKPKATRSIHMEDENPLPFNVYLVVLDDFYIDDQVKILLR